MEEVPQRSPVAISHDGGPHSGHIGAPEQAFPHGIIDIGFSVNMGVAVAAPFSGADLFAAEVVDQFHLDPAVIAHDLTVFHILDPVVTVSGDLLLITDQETGDILFDSAEEYSDMNISDLGLDTTKLTSSGLSVCTLKGKTYILQSKKNSDSSRSYTFSNGINVLRGVIFD